MNTADVTFIEVSPKSILLNPKEAARHKDTEAHARRRESIRRLGILQPPGVVAEGEFYKAVFGNGRVLNAQELNLEKITVGLFGRPMTEQEYLLRLGAENTARLDWTPFQLTQYIAELAATGMSQKEIAQSQGFDEPQVSRHRTIQLHGVEALLDAYRDGLVDFSKTFIVAKQAREDQPKWLAEALTGIKRDELQQKVRKAANAAAPTVKLDRVVCPLTTGTKIVVSGPSMDLHGLIDALASALESARKAAKDQIDVKTWGRVMADKAKASN